MKDFKAAYMAYYQTKLELAAGLKKAGLVASETRTDEQKAFQEKLLKAAQPPPAEPDAVEKKAEYVKYLPLATRCGWQGAQRRWCGAQGRWSGAISRDSDPSRPFE